MQKAYQPDRLFDNPSVRHIIWDVEHDVIFGSFLTPAAERPERVLDLARLTEQLRLDLVSVQDHPYQARFLDTWTLLSVIAASTSRITVAPDVANLPLRPPAVLARSVATLDLLSQGRVELGLGAGGFFEAIAAVGGPRLDARRAVDALEEGIRIIRAIWDVNGGTVRIDGEYYRVWGAHPGPAPAHDVGIWVGAYKKRMLGLTGRLADGWLPSSPYAPPDELPAMNRTIDAAAEEAGRDPADIRRLYNIAGRFAPRGTGFLQGPAEMWAEQLAELVIEQRFGGFIVMGDDADVLRRFAGEVVPAVRELVAAERSEPSPQTDTASSAGATTGPETIVGAGRTAAVRTARLFAEGLGVAPTPDDGARLSDRRVWDEATRPTGPTPEPDRAYTAHEQASGRHLVDVHDGLRAELDRVRDLIDQVTTGGADPGAVRDQINQMTIRQNNWTVGTYCASYCRIVTTHHTIEDRSVFPHLRRADPRLAPVIDRLEQEHVAIHGVLEQVDRALVAFVSGPDGDKQLREAANLLTDTLLSHLAYEERELVEPLARLGFY
jgi:alkanesulfonate monooxygenase SsuD/methylene tetrahydromethanopterin reductase-like flavin-dependent oxidoreductase (luciferase family)